MLKSGMVGHACNLSPGEAAAGGFLVQGTLGHSPRPYLENTNKYTKQRNNHL